MSGRPFVGRATELDELRAALDETAERRGSLFLLSGEPGIGKTRLMQELTREAGERGWRTAAGRCWEEGGAPAYWPWIQAVRGLGGEYEGLAAGAGAGESVDPETARFRLFDSVAEFLVDTAQDRPLIVALDDLHAADAASLVLLRFVSEAVADAPVLLVGSYREREARLHERPEAFAELVRVAAHFSLDGLSVVEVGAYVAEATGGVPSRSVTARFHLLTGGNPFFLGEVVRLVTPDGLVDLDGDAAFDPTARIPEEVRTLLRRRLAGLPDDAVEALRVAAVLGREFNLRVLERTSRLDVGRLLDVLAEASDAGVITEDPAAPRQYAFVHELVRETLYDDLASAERLALHGTIGAVLEDLYRNDLDPHLAEIARHLTLAAPVGDVSAAVGYLVRAGDRAARVLAYEEAGVHYERALALLGSAEEASHERRCDLLLRLGDARWRAGDTRAARSAFEEAVELARRLGDGEMLARAALGYVIGLGGFLLFARFEVGATGVGVLEEALAALPERDSPLRARVLARLAVEMYSSSDVERRLELSSDAIEMSRRLGDSEALVTALHARHWALGAPEMVHERLENTEEMLAVAAELGDQELGFLAHNARLHCFLELCDGPRLDGPHNCAGPDDVAKAVSFARDKDLLLAVRGGGHNGAGLGTCDGGVVVDLSLLTDVQVDPQARTVRVGGGCTWGEVDRATNEHGLAVPSGIISTTGVGGLTLGGGLGHLARKCGLTIDNLLEAEVVLASGERLRASADEHPDLYWAIRGGGGNFGVVTSFLFRLHEVGTVVGGPTFWPVELGAEVLSAYREFLPDAPRELNGFFASHTCHRRRPSPRRSTCARSAAWCGATPAPRTTRPRRWPRCSRPCRSRSCTVSRRCRIRRSRGPSTGSTRPATSGSGAPTSSRKIPDEAVQIHARFGAEMPTMKSTMHMYPIDGAVHDLAPSDTARSYRDARWASVFAGVDPDPVNADAIRSWSIDYFEALHPFSAGGAYVNMMMDEGQERVRASYRDNYDRLARVKAKYDPENLFRVNQNIEPRAS